MISYSEYELYPIASINARSTGAPKKGALIRWQKDGQFGYSDLCPLTEFGDSGIEDQLKSILSDSPQPLALRSLDLAKKDLEARTNKKSLFTQNPITNHFFIPNILNFDIGSLATLAIQGFHRIKFKMGRHLSLESSMLKEILKTLVKENANTLKIRLDFNSSITTQEFQVFLANFTKDELDCIEFIEDPCAYDANTWTDFQKQVTLAADLDEKALQSKGEGFDVLIIKPARQNSAQLYQQFKSKKIVVTHSQDHVVGQLHALAEAQELKSQSANLLTCGLQMLNTFEAYDLQKAITYKGSLIQPPNGHGIGLDKELSELEWKPLT